MPYPRTTASSAAPAVLLPLLLTLALTGVVTARAQAPLTGTAAPATSASSANATYDPEQVLVENRWAKITRGEYEAELLRIPANLRGGFATSNKRVIDLLVRMLVTKSLAVQARSGDLLKDPDIRRRRAAELDRVDANLLVTATEEDAGRAFDEKLPQFTARAKELYLSNPDKYRTGEEVDVSHILIDTKKRERAEALKMAMDVRARLAGGADFAALAKELSDDPSAQQNAGRLGYFGKGQMDPAFTEASFALTQVGEITGPILSSFGYHIIRLEARKPGRVRPFEEVAPELIAEERKKYVDAQRELLISRVREDALSRINQPAVDALTVKIDPEVLRKANELAPPK